MSIVSIDSRPLRFYPDEIPPFPHEPSARHFGISDFGTRGRGVYALASFEAGALLFAFSGIVVSEITQYSLQLADRLHIHDPWFMGFVLHSCDPNALCDVASRRFTAARFIAAGEPVTMDYESTEDSLYRRFRCICGSTRCRGTIRGRRAARA